MFIIRKPSQAVISSFLSRQHDQEFSYRDVGSTKDLLPRGYTIDHNRMELGHGVKVFKQAVALLRRWEMFKLGWVQLYEPNTSLEAGATVAILVNHFGFWSLNASRIVYVFDEDRRFGFAYGTLWDHAEQGEEKFSVEWSPENDSVIYDILAFSRPRQWQPILARPLGRILQRRFARDSMATMKRAINQRIVLSAPSNGLA